jgi:hypothetical protein
LLEASTRPVRPEDVTGRQESVAYFPINKEGFDAARAWGDSQVTRTNPGNTPRYSLLAYNCVDFSIDLVKHAGVNLPEMYAGRPVSTPSNLASKIRENNCVHDFEHTTEYPFTP